MKKLCSILILLAMLCGLLTSCEEGITTNREEAKIAYSRSSMTETPTRILYSTGGIVFYYNKITGENNVFCFDPLCKHTSLKTCISQKFILNGTNVTIQYSEYDNRFYTFRGQKLCSFAFDGSDLKIEYSFAENGDFEDWAYDPFYIAVVKVIENRVYFIALDRENGGRELYCFHTETKEMTNLSENIEAKVPAYLEWNGKLYFQLVGETESGTYCADLDMQNMEKISDHIGWTSDDPFLNGKFYYVEYDWNESGEEKVPSYISCVSLTDGSVTRLYELDEPVWHKILAVSEDYVYFIKSEYRRIGYEIVRDQEKERSNNYSRIYRLDVKSGACEMIFDDITCKVDAIYFLENNKVMILGGYCTVSEGNADIDEEMFIADVDENGYITNPLVPGGA